MSDLDLYAIHHLDRRAPSDVLVRQLTAQINAAGDPITRQRLDTARAILGDPARRAQYDAQLTDPAAPPITEPVLAGLAGHPAPMQASGLSAALAQPRARLLAVIAAALGVLLIVVVSAVACSGGDDAAVADSGRSQSQTSMTAPVTTTAKAEKLTLDSARAGDFSNSEAPKTRLKVVGKTSLAGQPGLSTGRVYLAQPNEQSVRAYWDSKSSYLEADSYRESRVQTWVDLAIGDSGTTLTVKGQPRSEKVMLGDNFVGEPATSGARKGVPDSSVGDVSGVFFFDAGAPGQVPRKAPTAQKQNYREVLGAVQQGDYVYVTVAGYPGVLIAELEKAQS